VGERALQEVAAKAAETRPNIYVKPIAGGVYGQQEVEYSDELTVLRQEEYSSMFRASNIGVSDFKFGVGVGLKSMPDLSLTSRTGQKYRVTFHPEKDPYTPFPGQVAVLRTQLLFAEWIEVKYATYGTNYIVTYAGDNVDTRENIAGWSGIRENSYEGRIQEHELRVGFDLNRAPYPFHGSLYGSILHSIEFAAQVGPKNVIEGYGTFAQFNSPIIPFTVVGRNDTFDYFYATGPVRLGIFEGKYRYRTDLGIERGEAGLNLWHVITMIMTEEQGLLNSPTLDEWGVYGGVPGWGFAGPAIVIDRYSDQPKIVPFGIEMLVGSRRGGIIMELSSTTNGGVRGSAALFMNW
jgi:hypothetical protein